MWAIVQTNFGIRIVITVMQLFKCGNKSFRFLLDLLNVQRCECGDNEVNVAEPLFARSEWTYYSHRPVKAIRKNATGPAHWVLLAVLFSMSVCSCTKVTGFCEHSNEFLVFH
jgi:hypothetical protein